MVVCRVVVVGPGAKETSEHTNGGSPAGSAIGYVPRQELDSCLLVAKFAMGLACHDSSRSSVQNCIEASSACLAIRDR